jgi:hypothetical protein
MDISSVVNHFRRLAIWLPFTRDALLLIRVVSVLAWSIRPMSPGWSPEISGGCPQTNCKLQQIWRPDEFLRTGSPRMDGGTERSGRCSGVKLFCVLSSIYAAVVQWGTIMLTGPLIVSLELSKTLDTILSTSRSQGIFPVHKFNMDAASTGSTGSSGTGNCESNSQTLWVQIGRHGCRLMHRVWNWNIWFKIEPSYPAYLACGT